MNKELIFLRTFAAATAIGMVYLTTTAFKETGNKKFSEIDVERINIVEKTAVHTAVILSSTLSFIW